MSHINVGSIVSSVAAKRLRVRRKVGSWSGHRWVEGPDQDVFIRGDVQSVDGRTERHLPEGVRTEDARMIYTTDDLRTSETGRNHTADIVEYGDSWWRVVRIVDWSERGYTAALVVRHAVGAEAAA